MSKIYDVDALLILATGMAAKRRPAELGEIIAAIDLLLRQIPHEAKLSQAFTRLSAQGLILEVAGAYRLSAAAEALLSDLPKKGDTEAKLFHVKDNLSTLTASPALPALTVTENALQAAVQAHRKALQDGSRNLLMPKPQPEDTRQRPGQRRRKPLPKNLRRR